MKKFLTIMLLTFMVLIVSNSPASAQKESYNAALKKHLQEVGKEIRGTGRGAYFLKASVGAEKTTLLITPKAAAWKKLGAAERNEIAEEWLFIWVGLRRKHEKSKVLTMEVVGVDEIISCTLELDGTHGCLFPRDY